ncbi:hypothetical protein D3C76_121470 [compost metagenome]
MHEFVAAARRWKILGHRPQRPDDKPSFLLRFAVSNFFRLLILVDQTSDQFDQPRIVGLAHGADAELLDQHYFVALWIVGQHAHRIVTHKHFTVDLAAHATGEQFMAQVQTIEFVKTLVAALASHDVDGGRNGVGKISHEHPLYCRSNTRLQLVTGNLDFAPS